MVGNTFASRNSVNHHFYDFSILRRMIDLVATVFATLYWLPSFFQMCCIGSLSCLFLSEWMYLSSFLVFVVLFSALCTCWLLVADVLGMIYFLPISWPKFVSLFSYIFSILFDVGLLSLQNTLLFLCIAVALLVLSSMLIHFVNMPSFLDETLNEDSLHLLHIAGVSPPIDHRISLTFNQENDSSRFLLLGSVSDSEPAGFVAGVHSESMDFVRSSVSDFLHVC